MKNKVRKTIKRAFFAILAVILLTSCTVVADSVADTKQAVPTTSKIFVDGYEVYIKGYNVDFNNYFKIRDLATVLADTDCKFCVSYIDKLDLITITTGNAPEDSFVQREDKQETETASQTSSPIFIDGKIISPLGYNIRFNNYFKLRDLGEYLGFNVEWNEEQNSIFITTCLDDISNPDLSYEISNSDNFVSEDIGYNAYRDQVSYFEELNQIVYLVNCEREKNGIQPLEWDLNLTNAAMKRSGELLDLFSHTRPSGEDCFSVFDEFSIDYRTAGENIAIGQSTPEKVMDSWMNSQGHRENILNPNYGKIGVGAVKVDQGHYRGFAWVQLFTN